MTIYASLVVGANGATTLYGHSRGLSTPADRERFLARHRSAGAFLIGRESAAREIYQASQVPIYVLTRTSEKIDLPHPRMELINVSGDLAKTVKNLSEETAGNLVVEAGPRLLLPLIEEGVIEILELTQSPIEGDGNFIDCKNLLSYFTITDEKVIDQTRLLECRYKGYATHG